MSPFLQRTLPSPRSPGAKSSGAPAADSAESGGPASRRLELADCSWTGSGSGEWAQRCRGMGSSRKQSRAGLHSLREAPLRRQAVVHFIPEVTLSVFACALGNCGRVPQGVPLGLWKMRESPALCDHSILSSVCFILSSPRLPRERAATRSHWLRASGGGVGW